MTKKITLTGPFTDDDVKFIFQVVRAIEQLTPNENFLLEVEDSDKSVSLEEEVERMKKIFPFKDGVPVDLRTFRKEKQDEKNSP